MGESARMVRRGMTALDGWIQTKDVGRVTLVLLLETGGRVFKYKDGGSRNGGMLTPTDGHRVAVR